MVKTFTRTLVPSDQQQTAASTGMLVEQWFSFTLANEGDLPVTYHLAARVDSLWTPVPTRSTLAAEAATHHQLLPGKSVSLQGGPTSLEWAAFVTPASIGITPGRVSVRGTISSTNPQSSLPLDPRSAIELAAGELLIDSALLVSITDISDAWEDLDMLVAADYGSPVVKYENLVAGGLDWTAATPVTYLEGLLTTPGLVISTLVDLPASMLAVVSFTTFSAAGSIISVGDYNIEVTNTGYRATLAGVEVAAVVCPHWPRNAVSLAVSDLVCTLTAQADETATEHVTAVGVVPPLVPAATVVEVGRPSSAEGVLSGVFIGSDPGVTEVIRVLVRQATN